MIGIAIANSLGLNKISGINPAAQAFITATGITGTTQIDAINALVNGLQADGLWSKMKAVYPFVTDNRNLLGYTTTFTSPNYVTDSTATFTLNNTTAPDGSNTGVRFTAVGSNNNYFYSSNTQGGNNFGTGNKAFSIYVKAGTFSGSMSLGITSDGSTTRTNFSLTNDWQRITITRNVIVAGNGSQYYIDLSGNSMTSGQYFYIWAPQFENGTTATTYQPIATTQQAYISSQFKYNLVNPVDSDAAFRLVFNGGWTHSSTGATPNGTNGYADTKLVPSSVLTNNNYHLSHYSRTQKTTGTEIDMGSFNGVPSTVGIALDQYYQGAGKAFVAGDYTTSLITSIGSTNTLGNQVNTRTSQTSAKIFFNNAQIGSTLTLSNPNALPNVSLYIGANHSSVSVQEYSSKQTAFSTIGDGLLDSEATALYNRVQQFQTALSRNV